jgi:N-formylglutamate deformylase
MSTDFPGMSHPDFVLGDRDGTTASSELTHRMAEHLRNCGFSVGVNHPYKGVEIVRRCGQPRRGVHSVQLEINRALYMNEVTLEMHQAANGLKEVLRVLAKQLLSETAQGLARRHHNL